MTTTGRRARCPPLTKERRKNQEKKREQVVPRFTHLVFFRSCVSLKQSALPTLICTAACDPPHAHNPADFLVSLVTQLERRRVMPRARRPSAAAAAAAATPILAQSGDHPPNYAPGDEPLHEARAAAYQAAEAAGRETDATIRKTMEDKTLLSCSLCPALCSIL